MATGMFENGVRAMMGADIDLVNDDIAALLVTSLYTPDLVNDTDQSDVPEAAIIATKNLTGKTLDGTVFRADNTVFTSVVGNDIAAIVLIKNTDSLGTSLLIHYIDNAPELPITPDGTDITIQWDLGVNGIFKL
jgi:hypothetical protein